VPSRAARLHGAVALIAALLAAPTARCGEGPSKTDREAAVKAGMVLNFIRFTEWPEEAFPSADSELVVTVLGEGDASRIIGEVLADQHVHGRPIEVRHVRSTSKPADGDDAVPPPAAGTGSEPQPAEEGSAPPAAPADGKADAEQNDPPDEAPAPEADDDGGVSDEVAEALRTSHVLFVCASESARLESILPHVRGKDVLTVSDMAGFAEHGCMLGLTVRRGRVGFDANTAPIDATRLKVSSQLLRLARLAKTKES
jgi:hypothetical protein